MGSSESIGPPDSLRDGNGQTWRGRGKKPLQEQSPEELVENDLQEDADENHSRPLPVMPRESLRQSLVPVQDGQEELEEQEVDAKSALGNHIFHDDKFRQLSNSRMLRDVSHYVAELGGKYVVPLTSRKRKDSLLSITVPRTPISRPRTPHTSRPGTPYTSRPGTPHVSRPGTPPISRPGSPVHPPTTPPFGRPSTPGHLPSIPTVPKLKNPNPYPSGHRRLSAATRPYLPNNNHQPNLPPATKTTALRRLRSTPNLTKSRAAPPAPRLPATWPQTTSHKTSSNPPYTWPPRNPYKKRNPHTRHAKPARKPSSTISISIAPASPFPTSICIHTLLSLPDHPNYIDDNTPYACLCSPATLRTQRSLSSFVWFDGAPQTAYPHAPERVEWCYCSGGEGHVVRSAAEAVEVYMRKEDERVARVNRLARMSEAQRAELEAVEWGGTEKALGKGRDCVGLKGRVKRVVPWLFLPWLCRAKGSQS